MNRIAARQVCHEGAPDLFLLHCNFRVAFPISLQQIRGPPPPLSKLRADIATNNLSCAIFMTMHCDSLWSDPGGRRPSSLYGQADGRTPPPPCPTNTSVWTVFFEDIINYVFSYVPGFRIQGFKLKDWGNEKKNEGL